jgi:hypothetical protein
VQITHKRLEHDRPRSLPVAVLVPIIGDSGVRAAAGAREHKQFAVALDEFAERSVILRPQAARAHGGAAPTTRKHSRRTVPINRILFTGIIPGP